MLPNVMTVKTAAAAEIYMRWPVVVKKKKKKKNNPYINFFDFG